MSTDRPTSPEPATIYTRTTYSREGSMAYLMRRIGILLIAEVDHRLQTLGLTHAQWAPLMLISKGKASTQAELARELSLDAGALTRTLDRLEAKGLCRRVRSTEDRRAVHIELTPEGVEAIAPVPAVLCDVSNVLLSGFEASEFEVLMAQLRRMYGNAEAMRQASEAASATSAATDTGSGRRGGRAARSPGRH